MKSFSKIYSDFWINYDNSEVLGTGVDGQLMALYLQSNTHHNMLGAYYLPLLYISSDLKLSVKKVQTALKKLCEINYCKYDTKTQYVWVGNLAFEQIGKDIGDKDNRIKALQEIWKSLPLQLEFLEDIYNKYHEAFYLELRDFQKHHEACEIKSKDTAVSNIQLSTECVPSFEGASKPLSNFLEEKSVDAVSKENLPEVPLEVSQISVESFSDVSDTTILVQDSLNGTKSEESTAALIPSEELQSTYEDWSKSLLTSFEHPSAPLRSPSEGPSNPLQSPFEGPSDPLRSNIEDRSKNIEEINKKKEIEEELEKEKRKNINNIQVLNSNIIAQARRCMVEQPNKNSFFEKSKETEKPGARKTKEPEKELCIQTTNNFPVVLANSNSELKPKTINSKNSVNDSVVAVFEHWKNTMKRPRSHLDQKRRALIIRALQEWNYSVEELYQAIIGCSLDPFHTGDNVRGQCYVGLNLILRDADHIDKFIHNCHSPPRNSNEAGFRLSNNVRVSKEWANKKHDELVGAMRNNYA